MSFYSGEYSEENPYGAWIQPDGTLIKVTRQCSHTNFCDYREAYKEGWICVVYGRSMLYTLLCFRYNPKTVTVEALKAMRKIYNDDPREEMIVDKLLDGQANLFGLGSPNTKAQGRAFIRKEIDRRSKCKVN